MKNEEYIKEIQTIRNLKDTAIKRYRMDLTRYSKYNNLTLHELLLEAEQEEEDRTRMRNRKIKKRLLSFQQYLYDEKLAPNTIRTTMSQVKSFYNTYEIELPKIKTVAIPITETIRDVPTIEHVRLAANTDRAKQKAIILFMASSGNASNETIKLTIQDFITATQEYHNETDIKNVLPVLKKQGDIIPTWTFIREKVNYEYYNFCSPEATDAIINYLETRENLTNNDSLFDIEYTGITKLFIRINERHDMGWKKTRRFFHSHALRKFFATTLTKARLDNLIIEWMLGHSIPSTKASYFKSDPGFLKEEYLKVVNHLSIREVIIQDRTPAQIKEIVRDNEAKEQRIRDLEEKDKIMGDLMRRVMEELDLEK